MDGKIFGDYRNYQTLNELREGVLYKSTEEMSSWVYFLSGRDLMCYNPYPGIFVQYENRYDEELQHMKFVPLKNAKIVLEFE